MNIDRILGLIMLGASAIMMLFLFASLVNAEEWKAIDKDTMSTIVKVDNSVQDYVGGDVQVVRMERVSHAEYRSKKKELSPRVRAYVDPTDKYNRGVINTAVRG